MRRSGVGYEMNAVTGFGTSMVLDHMSFAEEVSVLLVGN
jgi:hypothetical protein